MTELFTDSWEMPTADVGAVNPLPPLFGGGNLDKTADLSAATDEIRAGAAYGRVDSICPYLLQDSYLRRRSARRHPVAVLQNERLRAAFLLGAGGRLWSLVDLATGAELLFRNPVFQPANLALRNAWFAGGVEWNIGTIGHTPLTCEPLHAVAAHADDGTPVLRMYEFERLRRVVYQLDVHLPPGSDVLFVHVRITNPNSHAVPMYWWSNIAVPQTAGTRVLAPADRAWNYSYDNVLRHDPVAPGVEPAGADGGDGGGAAAPDITYPARFADAADFFFDLAGAAQPWIAAVDGTGTGIFQTSTRELLGRKLFRWGTGAGGRRWQEWLTGTPGGTVADPAWGYAEIQAGLARTQFEHVPMPAGAVWSWTEGYGRVTLPAAQAHGPWPAARTAAGRAVAAVAPAARLAQLHAAAELLADRAPDSVLHSGSGWGALEVRLRARAGEPALDLPGTPFPDETLGEQQRPWLQLLDTGTFPDPASGEMPDSVHLHPLVGQMLAESPGWAAPALHGVARMRAGDADGARRAWQESLERSENPYARRNLALLALREGDPAGAVEQYEQALRPSTADRARLVEPLLASGSVGAHPALAIEALRAYLAAGRPDRALALVDRLPVDQRERGRIRLLEATAALAVGDLARCGGILTDPDLMVADLREGEDSLDQLWWDYRTRLAAADRGVPADAELRAQIERTDPVPAQLDFRMRPPAAG